MRLFNGEPLEEREVPGDGNCLFNAFSSCLVESIALAARLRQDAVQTISTDWERWGPFTEAPDGTPYTDACTYRTAMSKSGTYACQAEARALADLHCVHLQIYEGDRVVVDVNPERIDKVRLLFLRDRCHYNALQSVMIGQEEDAPFKVVPNSSNVTCTPRESDDAHDMDMHSSSPEAQGFMCSGDEDMFGPPHSFAIGGEQPRPRSFGARTFPPHEIHKKSSRAKQGLTTPTTYMSARLYAGESTSTIYPLDMGSWNIKCVKCGAIFLRAERLADGVNTPAWCCGREEQFELTHSAMLAPIQDERVHELYYGESDDAVHFRRHARAYNTILSVAMPAVKYERRQVRGNQVIAINGKATFNAPAHPRLDDQGLPQQPGQLYFVEMTDASIKKRIMASSDPHLRPHIVELLIKYLEQHNALVKTFLLAREVMQQQERQLEDQDMFEDDYTTRGLHLLVNPHRDGFRVTDRPLFSADGSALRPQGSEFVAAVFEGEQPTYNYDVALFPRRPDGQRLTSVTINEQSPTIDNLLYILIHLHAEDSWVRRVTLNMGDKRRKTNNLISTRVGTLKQYYSARLMRRGDKSQAALFRLRGLFQQFLVDAAVKIEDANLRYAEQTQDELYVAQYDSLKKYVDGLASDLGRQPGRIVLLPKNRQRSERRMHDNYIDAATISARTGRPTFLVTMTTNPRWPEIVEALRDIGLCADEYVHAPDVVVRAFMVRVHTLIGHLVGKAILGRVLSFVGVVEFTTTFLPHFHLVLIMPEADRPTQEDIDSIVCAEIPNKEDHPELHTIILNMGMHRPCDGSSPTYSPTCLDNNGKCRHGFPFALQESTSMTRTGPVLRRRENAQIWHRGFHCFVDNRWVVPYNPALTLAFQCHLNVMTCGDNMFWPYLFGYMMKESCGQFVQGAMLQYVLSKPGETVNWNEVEFYQTMRMLGSYEAVFHILDHQFVIMSHSVVVLPVHLPGKQYVYYRGEPNENQVLQETSKLLAFFRLMAEREDLRHILYADLPSQFVYSSSQKKWTQKSDGTTIGRLMHVNPSPRNMEIFFLRLLLLNRPGPVSFLDLLTVEGKEHGTFKEACEALGLSTTSGVCYDTAIDEVASHGSAWQLRRFFALLAAVCQVGHVSELWLKYRDLMSGDYRQRGSGYGKSLIQARAHIMHHFLILLDAEKDSREERASLLAAFRRELTVPDPSGETGETVPPEDQDALDGVGDDGEDNATSEGVHADTIVSRQPRAQHSWQELSVEEHKASYSAEQRLVHETVMSAILDRGDAHRFFSLEAAAGCGKTYVYNGLIKECHALGIHTVSSAMTGIASLLLIDGDTANKTFGIPVKGRVDGTERSYLQPDSPAAQSLINAGLIVVDEVSMMALWQVRLIDHLMRFLTQNEDSVFGGKVVLLGGDMGQILPVMRGHSMRVVTAHSLPAWEHWQSRTKLHLTINRRAAADHQFSAWLASVRDGSANVKDTDDIVVPSRFLMKSGGHAAKPGRTYAAKQKETTIDNLIAKVYGDFSNDRVEHSVVLAPVNADVRALNNRTLSKLPRGGPTKTYVSTTKLVQENIEAPQAGRRSESESAPLSDGGFTMAQEELDAVERPNLPPHRLNLRIGCVVMLLKNFNKAQGLCNGTRLRIEAMYKDTVCVRRITPFQGRRECMFFPKLWLRSDDVPLPGSLERYQFPLTLAFVVTINKSQGQTFEHVGLYLERPVFAHGQFYVAVSRATSGENLSIVVIRGPHQGPALGNRSGKSAESNTRTKNIVIRQVLL